jgi:two-component system LytT family response regulator
MKAIIIDDEKKAQVVLAKMLDKYCSEVNVVAVAGSVVAGLETIRTNNPDLVFLDIQMDDGTGFDLLKKLTKQNFHLVFTTAFDAFALKAFRFSAMDYLIKPIDPDELINTVDRCQSTQTKNSAQQSSLLQAYIQTKTFNKIALPEIDGINYVEVNQIIRCKADVNYTLFYMNGGKKIVVAKTLKTYQEFLCGEHFLRIHKSHIINLEYVVKYIKGDGGEVEMSDGSILPVARKMKQILLKSLGNK